MNGSEKSEVFKTRNVMHARIVIVGICVNIFLFIFNVNSYFTLATVNHVQAGNYDTYRRTSSNCDEPPSQTSPSVVMNVIETETKTPKPSYNLDSVGDVEKATGDDIIEEWEQRKEDKNIFYSIFDDVEQWPPFDTDRQITRRILIHVNSRNILTEVASDVRMMHRQVQRVLHIKHPDCQFDLKFWVQSNWPSGEGKRHKVYEINHCKVIDGK